MNQLDLTVVNQIKDLIATEIAEFTLDTAERQATLKAFLASQCPPEEEVVNFSGGLTQKCWATTQFGGDYRVYYMPLAGYFSLCVKSAIGPLDIGVHGTAIGCFSSV